MKVTAKRELPCTAGPNGYNAVDDGVRDVGAAPASAGGNLRGKTMTRHGKPSGLTLGETLFLVFVCAFVLLILIPLLRRPQPMTAFPSSACTTHLAGIGKAMLIYANDYQDELPRAGGRDTSWAARTPNWMGKDRAEAFGLAADRSGGQASISASLYLLVKYEELVPKMFLCAESQATVEKGMSEFKLATYGIRDKKLTDLWDFGPNPTTHVSYAYHMPYGQFKLTISSPPGFAVAADHNPWLDSPSTNARDFARFKPDIPPFKGSQRQALHGNTFRHDAQGQNVFFLDGHVEFAKRPFCGLDDDNIYTISGNSDTGDPLGTPPQLGSQPAHPRDSLLVNDPLVPPK
jgi:prepilin-type processing-associated H-X9-DG protein